MHGLIERIDGTHRYHVTNFGLRTALFFTRTYARVLRPGLAQVMPTAPPENSSLHVHFRSLERAMDHWVAQAKLIA